ncbi:hypothetical protein ElyMa_003851200 [Elysia marginata]|uniref:Secreted protein n=1 Tax=Elysia marginata TaxID=1093978 RepID=A0AAV4FIA1_9GAST|nr:hypothetical protein ElyMa_003851200 [Elysia marginata]
MILAFLYLPLSFSRHAFLHRLAFSFPTQQQVSIARPTWRNWTLTFANVLSAARLNGPFVWLSGCREAPWPAGHTLRPVQVPRNGQIGRQRCTGS